MPLNTQELNRTQCLPKPSLGHLSQEFFPLIPKGRREGHARRQERVREAMLWGKIRMLSGRGPESGHVGSCSYSSAIVQAGLRFAILLPQPLSSVIVNTVCQVAGSRITVKTNAWACL